MHDMCMLYVSYIYIYIYIYMLLQGPYFIGKTLWSKGYDKLLPLLRSYRRYTGENFEMEAYGDGPDKKVSNGK
jgi:hypothetical protein